MINEVLDILRKRANDHLRMGAGGNVADAQQDWVVFPSSDRLDLADFKPNVVTILLINLKQDRTVRPADPYLRTLPDGTILPGRPPVVMNVYVLFVARFTERTYAESVQRIARIVQLFQEHPVLDHENTPDLGDRIEKLVIELLTLPFSEQNHLWGILRTTYLPSVLYKVRMLVFDDAAPAGGPPIEETTTIVKEVAP